MKDVLGSTDCRWMRESICCCPPFFSPLLCSEKWWDQCPGNAFQPACSGEKLVWNDRMEGCGCTYVFGAFSFKTMDLFWFIISLYLTWLCTVWSLFPKGFEKMRDTHSSLDHDIKHLVCSLARDDGNPYEKISFILSISNSQICIFIHYSRSHIDPCVHNINNYI